jgi:hypothetical protein
MNFFAVVSPPIKFVRSLFTVFTFKTSAATVATSSIVSRRPHEPPRPGRDLPLELAEAALFLRRALKAAAIPPHVGLSAALFLYVAALVEHGAPEEAGHESMKKMYEIAKGVADMKLEPERKPS